MTKDNAIFKANSKARQFKEIYLVVYEDGDYFPASVEESETFFKGAEIVYSTDQ